MGNNTNEVLFSIAFSPLEKESLFQNINNSSKTGEAITSIKIHDVLVNFNFRIKIKLKTPNKIINNEHGFLKIIAIAIRHKKTWNNLLKFFSERFIV